MDIKKEVQLFGCGKIANEFYREFKDKINITYMISNNPKELIFNPETGVEYEVRRPMAKDRNNSYIIICSCEYENIAEQLILLGYTPMVDFIDYELATIFMEEKKIVLLYGMCHLRGIKDYLKVSDNFCNNYTAVYYPNYLYQNAYQQLRLNYFVEHCHVFIYGAAVTPENHRKNMAILERLNSEVKKMCLHTVYFGAYFPQKKRVYNDMNKYAVKCENYDYTPFSYEDSWLNECIDRGMSASDVLTFIEKDSPYNRDYILKYLEGEWKRLRFQEKESDFKILDYIMANYRSMRLFRNEAHMENDVLYQYAVQVLEQLGCYANLPIIEEPLLRCSQHCIYPAVSEALQLEWDVREEILDIYTYNGWKKVTLTEYVRTYLEIGGDIRNLKKKYFLP